jgi:hypothetical protein
MLLPLALNGVALLFARRSYPADIATAVATEVRRSDIRAAVASEARHEDGRDRPS